MALATRWPKKFCDRTHMKSCSMSVSAMTMRLSGFADSFSTVPAAATPAGAPFGKADFTLPLMRAASVYFCPVGLNPSRSCDGSNSIANRCAGITAA